MDATRSRCATRRGRHRTASADARDRPLIDPPPDASRGEPGRALSTASTRRSASHIGCARAFRTHGGYAHAAQARAMATWNRNRAAVNAWLTWCHERQRWSAPAVPGSCERRKEHVNATKDLPKAAIERQLSRRDVPLREKTLWRMLYETAARASEILDLDVERLDLDNRRAPSTPRAARSNGFTGEPAPPTCSPGSCASPTARSAQADRCSWPTASRARSPSPCTRHLPAHRPRQTRLRPRPNRPQ
jgi:integrase